MHTFPLFHIGAELTLTSDSVYGMEGMDVVICVMHARHNLERNVSVNIQLMEDSASKYILKCAVYTPSSPFAVCSLARIFAKVILCTSK